MKPVTMYGSPWCSYSHLARRLLTDKGVPFDEIDVIEQPERRAEMVGRSAGRNTRAANFIGDQHIGGFDDIYELDRSGKLDRLLADD